MKVALVNPLPVENSTASIPHGLLQLAAELRRAKHAFHIFDFNDGVTPLDYAPLSDYDLVGISVNSLQLTHAIEIAQALNPNVSVAWGGVHCFLDPMSILRAFPGHWVVNGDGERPLLDILDHLSGKIPIDDLMAKPGICLMGKTQPIINPPHFNTDLEALADIDYHDLPNLERYFERDLYYVLGKTRSLGILTSRGCHWRCAFCINTLMAKAGGTYRAKSFAKIRRETEPILDKYKITFLNPTDEDFFLNMQFVEHWRDYAKEKGFLWGANCRYNYFKKNLITPTFLQDLCNNGLYVICMSIEAGDENIRNKVLNKRVKDADIQEAIQVISDSGMRNQLSVNTSFIINFPGDSKQSRIKMLNIMDQLSKTLNITFSGPQVYRHYPGSPLSNDHFDGNAGDLQFYLNELGASRATRATLDADAFFYTHVARVFFNERFRFFRLSHDDHGRPILIPTYGRQSSTIKSLAAVFIKILFLTTLIRLKSNCWHFFIEPKIIGRLAKTASYSLRILRGNRIP